MLRRKWLEQEIELVRMQMEQSAAEKGLTDPSVYKLSKKLDHLHNLWHRLHKEERDVYFSRPKTSVIREVMIVHR